MINVHLAWISFQRRQDSLSKLFNLECIFFGRPDGKYFVSKFFSYVKFSFLTYKYLRKVRPASIWVQVPQTPLLFVALMYRRLTSQKILVVADCHNAIFRSPWLNVPFTKLFLAAADFVVIHNDDVLSSASKIIDVRKILVIPDPPSVFNLSGIPERDIFDSNELQVVYPASWAPDEPIAEVVQCAREMPAVIFQITGKPKPINGVDLDSLPPNLILPGFISVEALNDLIVKSDIVLALTRHEGVQLSVCGEAIGAEKPLICSNTHTLNTMYVGYAEFSDNDAAALQYAISNVRKELAVRKIRAKEFSAKFSSEWKRKYSKEVMRGLVL